MSVNVADGRRHRGSGLPKYYNIKTVAEALDVSSRTIRLRAECLRCGVCSMANLREGCPNYGEQQKMLAIIGDVKY